MYLRLTPESAIDKIYQRFYYVGRPIAGKWTYAETSSEYLHKLITSLNEHIDLSKYEKLFANIKDNATALTDLYHATLFVDMQINKKDARNSWTVWAQLRRQLYTAKLILFFTNKKNLLS